MGHAYKILFPHIINNHGVLNFPYFSGLQVIKNSTVSVLVFSSFFSYGKDFAEGILIIGKKNVIFVPMRMRISSSPTEALAQSDCSKEH